MAIYIAKTLFIPDRNNALSSQALLNPEYNVLCCYLFLINEKRFHSARAGTIGRQRETFSTCQLCVSDHISNLNSHNKLKSSQKTEDIPASPSGKKAQNEYGLPFFENEPSNCNNSIYENYNQNERILVR